MQGGRVDARRHRVGILSIDDAARVAFSRAGVARLATIDDREQPNVVPICFALHDDVVYSAVDEKPKRSRELKRLENIRARPAVSVLVDHFESDWSRLWWVVVEGRAEILDPGDEASDGLQLLAAKYPQYAAATPRGPVIAVRVTRWRSWSATPDRWASEV